MSSVRDPIEKKRLAYDRDHYAKGKNDKLFRKAWPKIKRTMVRAGRHIAEEAVRAAKRGDDVILPARPPKKYKLHKRSSPTLRQVVEAKTKRRERSVGAKKRRKVRWQAMIAAASAEIAARERAKQSKATESKQYKRRANKRVEATSGTRPEI